jgi:N6-adenosine-specific RNA methylase IME4
MPHVEPTPPSVIIERRAGGFEETEPTCAGWWYHRPRGREAVVRLVLVAADRRTYRPEKGTAVYQVEGDEGRWLGFGGPAGWPVVERTAALEAVNQGRMAVHQGLTKQASKLWRTTMPAFWDRHFGLLRNVEEQGHPPFVVQGTWDAMPAGGGTESTVYTGYAVVQGDRHCYLGPTVEQARHALERIDMATPPHVHQLDWSRVGSAVAADEDRADRMDRALAAATDKGVLTQSMVMRALGCGMLAAAQVVDDLVAAGRIARVREGVYQLAGAADPQGINHPEIPESSPETAQAEPVSQPYKLAGNCDEDDGNSQQFPPQSPEAPPRPTLTLVERNVAPEADPEPAAIWDLPVYPAAGLFPMLDDEALVAMSQDIARHGLRHPIVVWRGQLLDGRNRREACRLADVAPEVISFEGDESAALAFVASVNLRRRHLPASQAALIAAQLLGSAQGPAPAQGGKRAAVVADAAGVSTRSVEHGVRVLERGAPELVEAVREGSVAVHTAAALASLPQAEQIATIATADPKAIKAAAKAIQRQEAGEKRAKQDARRLEAVKAARLILPSVELCQLRHERVEDVVDELAGVGSCTLISMDVPWSYSNTGVNGATDKHYGEHGTPEGFAGIVHQLGVVAAPDAYLLFWVTNPMLGEWMAARERACAAGKSGGWKYLTMITWAKDGRGIGFHAIGDTEHVLVYARGNPRVFGPVPSTLQAYPRGEAEEKPVELQQRLVAAYSAPGAVVLDLYAGRASLGEAALREGRRYMGVEASEERYQLGLIRLAGVGPDPRQLTIDDAIGGAA